MFKKFKKLICFIFIICLSLTVFVACKKEEYNWGPIADEQGLVTDAGTDNENGGMAVAYGKYLYFINGMDGYDSSLRDNEFGAVIKGSICRIPLDDVGKSNDERNERIKVIVPKVFYASNSESGFFIFNDWIYYTTANSDRGSSGTIQYSIIDFMKVRVDGTGTERIKKLDAGGADVPFKFIQATNGHAYLIYFLNGTLFKLDATTNGATETISENVTSYAFGTSEVYYTHKETKTNKQDQETEQNYNTIYSLKPDSAPVEISHILAGVADEADYDKENAGFKYTVNSVQKDILFYTRTRALGGVDADTGLWGYNGAAIKPFTMDYNGTNFFVVSWIDGLVVYTGTQFVRYPAHGTAARYDQMPYVIYTPSSSSVTLYALSGNDLYYGVSESSGEIIWRFDITNGTAGHPMRDSLCERVTLNAVYSSWLKPKLIGDRIYFISLNNFRDSEGEEVIDEYAEDGYRYYTYFVDIRDIPDAKADDDELSTELEKEIWIGIHDILDKDED